MNKQITKYSALALGLALVASPYVAATAQIIKHIDAAREAYYAKLKAKPWGQVAEKYIKQLTEEEEALWLQLDKALGDAPGTSKNFINKLEWSYLKEPDDWHPGNGNYTDPNKKTTIQFFSSLLKECGLNPKYIAVLVHEKIPREHSYGCSVSKTEINYVSEIAYLSYYTPGWIMVTDITKAASVTKFKVDALQSIMHYMHYDGWIEESPFFGFFKYAAKKEDTDSEDKQSAAILERLFLHIHKRSDALVALLSPEYAVQYIENLRSLKNVTKELRNLKNAEIERYYKDKLDRSTVQSYDERIAFLETIYKEMLACQ